MKISEYSLRVIVDLLETEISRTEEQTNDETYLIGLRDALYEVQLVLND